MRSTHDDERLSGFWDAELEICSVCGTRKLTPASPSLAGLRVCLTCGVVPAP